MSSGPDRRQLLGSGLAALLVGSSDAAAQPATACDDLSRELELRRNESLLLHRKLDLRGLQLLRGGKLVAPKEPPLARLLILHLWAVECRPCLDELPILQRIAESLRPMPQVQVALACETLDLPKLQQFLDGNRAILPRGEHYVSSDDRLRAALQNRSQPTTLLLDALTVVRHSFLGSLRQRRSELAEAIQRLSRL